MSDPDIDPENLRRLLAGAESDEAIRRLMTAIVAVEGEGAETAADWFGFGTESVLEWLGEFEEESPEDIVARLDRFELPGRQVTPTGQNQDSHVEYLHYETIQERDWNLDDPDLFHKARTSDLEQPEYGGFVAPGGQSILEAAEDAGLEWPHSCRGGACSNCAVILVHGEISMPGNQILPGEALEQGARLTCVGTPISARVEVVYGVDHLDFLEDLRLESRPRV